MGWKGRGWLTKATVYRNVMRYPTIWYAQKSVGVVQHRESLDSSCCELKVGARKLTHGVWEMQEERDADIQRVRASERTE